MPTTLATRASVMWRSAITVLGKVFSSISATNDVHTGVQIGGYGELHNRLSRYALNTAYYENTAYDSIHAWAHQASVDYKLYADIRNIFNPTHREVEFWAMHIYAGALDPDTGDGKSTPTAIPIETED